MTLGRGLAVAAMIAAAAPAACDDEGGSGSVEPHAEAHRAVLASVADNVVLPGYRSFLTAAGALDDAVDAWVASGSTEDREAARAAWRAAIANWQEHEAYQLGPAGVMGDVVGGEDLRDRIYSWPVTNPCRVDQELVEQAYVDVDAFAGEAVNVRGLDALEYLLFHEGTDNDCAPQAMINTDGSWAALDADTLAQRRAVYAATLTELLERAAQAIVDAWEPGSGGFRDALATAGAGSAVYGRAQEALNSLSDALFYLDKEVKDMKLAPPAGLSGCAEDTCPERRESRFADASLAHVVANLRGFRAAYHGGQPGSDGPGFDDLLRDRGASALADEIEAAIAKALATAEGIDQTLVSALADDPEAVRALHADLRALTTLLKTQFVSTLDLELPKRAEGDND